jgi:CheY-like chemotaxis protein
VKAHGGLLTYEPPPEGGAEFRIVFPAVAATALPVEEPAPAPRRPTAQHILVVDDDLAVHRLVSALFASEGHVVEAVRSGEQALRMLRERTFDLVIADAMARAGATQLFIHAVATEAPETCRRLILGHAGGESAEDIDGGVCRLQKPFNLRDLRARGAEILAASNPPPPPASTGAR